MLVVVPVLWSGANTKIDPHGGPRVWDRAVIRVDEHFVGIIDSTIERQQSN